MDSMTDASATRVGEYEVLSILGDGATGKVFKVICAGDRSGVARNEIAALKVVNLATGLEGGNEVFIRQADSLRRLSHPGIVRYRDSFCWTGEWDESGCLVMEFLDGETLSVRIRKSEQGLQWSEAKPIVEQCMEALIYANRQKITHRDIKPSNIFITHDGRIKLIDFDTVSRTACQRAEIACGKGTYDYMAPDFAVDGEFGGDEVSDIFSLSVVIYELLTGASPFPKLEGNASAGYSERWNRKDTPRPSFHHGSFRVLCPAGREFLEKGLERDRNKRFGSFHEMLGAFRQVHARTIKASTEYELVAYLGKGGFGEVYKARRVRDNAAVAVKYLYSSAQPERFEKEARALRKSSNKYIVQYIDFAKVEETAGMTHSFIVMEFLEGMPGWSLRNRLFTEPGGLAMKESLQVFSHYLDAIQHLHSRKLIHRDIKPANLYAPEGRPDDAKVFDLGVAKDVSGTATSGQIPGTLDYMAPEFGLGRGERGSERSDIYSLGLSFYEALSGKTAFPRLPKKSIEALVEFMKRATAPVQLEIDFNCAPFIEYPVLADVVRLALARDPIRRFKSAGDMKRAVDRILADILAGGRGEGGGPVLQDAGALAGIGQLASRIYKRGQTVLRHKPQLAPQTTSLHAEVNFSSSVPLQDEAARQQRRLILRVITGLTVGLGVLALVLVVCRDLPRARARSRMQRVYAAVHTPEASRVYVTTLKNAVDQAERWRAKDADHIIEWDLWISSVNKTAVMMPALVARAFDDTVVAADKARAESVIAEWDAMSGLAEFMGLNAIEYESMRLSMRERFIRFDLLVSVRQMEAGVPVMISSSNVRLAEDVARQYVEMLDRLDAEGDTNLRDGLRRVSEALSRSAALYVTGLTDAATTEYGHDRESGNRRLSELESFEKQAPLLVNLVRRQYDEAIKLAHGARQSTM